MGLSPTTFFVIRKSTWYGRMLNVKTQPDQQDCCACRKDEGRPPIGAFYESVWALAATRCSFESDLLRDRRDSAKHLRRGGMAEWSMPVAPGRFCLGSSYGAMARWRDEIRRARALDGYNPR